jgi:hypothetical protein
MPSSSSQYKILNLLKNNAMRIEEKVANVSYRHGGESRCHGGTHVLWHAYEVHSNLYVVRLGLVERTIVVVLSSLTMGAVTPDTSVSLRCWVVAAMGIRSHVRLSLLFGLGACEVVAAV